MRGDVVIRDARDPADIPAIRRLFEAYAASLDVDLCFQNFAHELAALPGDYAPPHGALLLAERGDVHVGCVALRPLRDEVPRKIGEVKRLYVVPDARGARTGHALMQALIARAQVAGYDELKLDTLATMASARTLYAALGFRPCAPYYPNPLPGVGYLSLTLRPPA